MIDAAEFVERFLVWATQSGYVGWVPWPEVKQLAYEFATYAGVQVISKEAFAGACSKRGIAKKYVYLKPGDPLYIRKKDEGQQRPRLLHYDLPRVTAGESLEGSGSSPE